MTQRKGQVERRVVVEPVEKEVREVRRVHPWWVPRRLEYESDGEGWKEDDGEPKGDSENPLREDDLLPDENDSKEKNNSDGDSDSGGSASGHGADEEKSSLGGEDKEEELSEAIDHYRPR